jgi:hypothetical protein
MTGEKTTEKGRAGIGFPQRRGVKIGGPPPVNGRLRGGGVFRKEPHIKFNYNSTRPLPPCVYIHVQAESGQ